MTNFVFGQWVKKLRKQFKLSRREVAQRSAWAISQQYIHFIETGRATNIGSDKLKALAQGLGVPMAVCQQALYENKEPSIPVLGHVAAGNAAHLADDEYGEEFLSYIRAEEELFAVEIIGDSMAPRLEHTDMALVQPWQKGDAILSGGIYVLKHRNGKVTCKYLVPDALDHTTLWLEAEQQKLFQPIRLDDEAAGYRILGRVIEVRKTGNLRKSISPQPV